MDCVCPKCLKTTDIDVDEVIISFEDAKRILGVDLNEVRARCKHCNDFVTFKVKTRDAKVVTIC